MSSEPTNPQTQPQPERCESFEPGHNTHWIPITGKFRDKPEAQASVVHVEANKFTVTSMGRAWTFYFHRPDLLIKQIELNPTTFKHILGTSYVINVTDEERRWFHLSHNEPSPCHGREPKAIPYPFQKPEELF